MYITVTVKPHFLFDRRGNDISYDVPITLAQAVSGCTLELPTVDGDTVRQVVPEGTQDQTVFKIRNKGVPNVNGRGRGDLYVRVLVEVPKGLSRKQKDLLAQLETELGDRNYELGRKYREKLNKIKKTP